MKSILYKNPIINTAEDLKEYILSDPSIYENLPTRIKNNLTGDIQNVILIIDYALRQGLLSTKEVYDLISFDTCNEEILHVWCEMMNIPLPRFPNQSHARVHIQSEYTFITPSDWEDSYVVPCYVADDYVEPQEPCSPLVFDFQYIFKHNLGTHNYVFQVSLFDGSNTFLVNAEDYFDIIIVNPNEVILGRNTTLLSDGLFISNVAFIYHKDYLYAKRLIARNAIALDGMRYTVKGLKYYLELLLNNNGTINIVTSSNISVLFQFLRFDDNSNNLNNCRFTIFDGPNLSEFDPKIFPGYSFSNATMGITITSDLQKDIVEFIEDAIINYFVPFKTVIGKNVTFTYIDTTTDWINKPTYP